jgi:hypothetical protein
MLLCSTNDIDPHELTSAWFKILGTFIAIVLMVGEAASAEQTPGQASADWTQSYGQRNKDCLEWTDTCVNSCALNAMSALPPIADITRLTR